MISVYTTVMTVYYMCEGQTNKRRFFGNICAIQKKTSATTGVHRGHRIARGKAAVPGAASAAASGGGGGGALLVAEVGLNSKVDGQIE